MAVQPISGFKFVLGDETSEDRCSKCRTEGTLYFYDVDERHTIVRQIKPHCRKCIEKEVLGWLDDCFRELES